MNTKFQIMVFSYLMLLLGCKNLSKIHKVDNIIIYKEFPENGTTNYISFAFKYPQKSKVNTSVNDTVVIQPETLENLLNNAKARKHFQQKLGGVTFAGEFYEQSKKHYFVYFKSVNLIIDFTDRINYFLKQELKYNTK